MKIKTSRKTFGRRAATFLAALGLLVMSSGVALMAVAAPAEAAKVDKSYVCKWVKKPGSDTEVLQTGQNPIWVDNHALGIDGPARVGQEFNDGQVRSVVIVANTAKLNPEPGIEACRGTAPSGQDLAAATTRTAVSPPTVVDPPAESTVVIPTVVEAGLAGTTTDLRGEQGLVLFIAGVLMLGVGSLGLRTSGRASRI